MVKIKCTYTECFRHFKSNEDMIRHKVKEPQHDYCKRCDEDCEDDLAYLIHQISSPKHICCPIDGLEFESKSGRDSHVERNHPQKQDLECVGCGMKFTRAAPLMFHVENDECKVIKLEDFERQRAEKQIQKDAWASALDPTGGAHLPSQYLPSNVELRSDADDNGGVSLMDDESVAASKDWAGKIRSPLRAPLKPTTSGSYTAPRPALQGTSELSNGMSNLTLDKFPPLAAQPNTTNKPKSNDSASTVPTENDDLLDLTQPDQGFKAASGPWHTTSPVKRLLFPENKSPLSSASTSQLGPVDNMSDLTTATNGASSQQPARMWDTLSQMSSHQRQPPIAPAARPENNDPNAHITSTVQNSPPSAIDPQNYWHPLEELFVCPGLKCGRKFDTPEGFSAHLLTGAHVGGRTQCPSCLRKFRSTTALIAHCESGGKRCLIRKSANYNQVLRELTAGLLGTEGFLQDGSVRYVAIQVEDW